MTTQDDEIIEEIRRHREAHAASLDHDMKRITADLQRQEQESGAQVVTRLPRKPIETPGASSAWQAVAADGLRPPLIGDAMERRV